MEHRITHETGKKFFERSKSYRNNAFEKILENIIGEKKHPNLENIPAEEIKNVRTMMHDIDGKFNEAMEKHSGSSSILIKINNEINREIKHGLREIFSEDPIYVTKQEKPHDSLIAMLENILRILDVPKIVKADSG